jgi:hypothetical protein
MMPVLYKNRPKSASLQELNIFVSSFIIRIIFKET